MCLRCDHFEAQMASWRAKMDQIQMRLLTDLKKAQKYNQDFELTTYEMLTVVAQAEAFMEKCQAKQRRRPRRAGLCVKPVAVRPAVAAMVIQ